MEFINGINEDYVFTSTYDEAEIHTLLIAATMKNHMDLENFKKYIEIMEKGGANINFSKLLFETFTDDKNIYLDFLISKGASVNIEDKDGDSLLLLFARRGNIYGIRKLMEHGVNLFHRNKEYNDVIYYLNQHNKEDYTEGSSECSKYIDIEEESEEEYSEFPEEEFPTEEELEEHSEEDKELDEHIEQITKLKDDIIKKQNEILANYLEKTKPEFSSIDI